MKRVTLEQFAHDPDAALKAANVAPVLIANPEGGDAVLISRTHYAAIIDELKAYGVAISTEQEPEQ